MIDGVQGDNLDY